MSKRRKAILFGIVIIASLCILHIALRSPSCDPDPVYRWPIGAPLRLSGTMGERRGLYLHHGIDIKTQGRVGYPVYAALSGWMRRIMSGTGGYGNALILDHGTCSSLYAHLQEFGGSKYRVDDLAEVLKRLYNSNRIDFIFYKNSIAYSAGDLIGYSGESGSGHPHLHFEMRQKGGTLNPLKYFKLKDDSAPVIRSVFFCYPVDGTTVYEKRVRIQEGWFRLKPGEDPVLLPAVDRMFMKVSCYDQAGAENRVGVYRIQLLTGREKFEFVFDSLNWSDSRRAPELYDISKSRIDGEFVYTYSLRGGSFSGICSGCSGEIRPGAEKVNLKLIVEDYALNRSEVEIAVKKDSSIQINTDDFTPVKPNRTQAVASRSGDIELRIWPYSVADKTRIRIAGVDNRIFTMLSDGFSIKRSDIINICRVDPSDIVFNKPVQILFKTSPGITASDAGRIFIYRFFEGERPDRLHTYSRSNGVFSASSRLAGIFALVRDTQPPSLAVPPTHELFRDRNKIRLMRFYIDDSLSGVDTSSIDCYIDGEKFPFIYDRDRRWIEVSLPGSGAAGLHHVLIYCSDYSKNRMAFRGLFWL